MLNNVGATLQTANIGFQAVFKKGFGQAEPDHLIMAMKVESSTNEEEYGWLGNAPSLREWVGERELQAIRDYGFSIKNRTFEVTQTINRDVFDDDRYGIYSPIFSELGRAAAAHPTELMYELLLKGWDTLCYDGQNFFDTDHEINGETVANTDGGNGSPWFLMDLSREIKPMIHQTRRAYDLRARMKLDDPSVWERNEFEWGVDGRCNVGFGLWQFAYGSKQPLNKQNYESARKAMLKVKNDRGRPMGVTPTHLVFGPDLEGDARRLIKVDRDAAGATNEWYGTAELVRSEWLEAAA